VLYKLHLIHELIFSSLGVLQIEYMLVKSLNSYVYTVSFAYKTRWFWRSHNLWRVLEIYCLKW